MSDDTQRTTAFDVQPTLSELPWLRQKWSRFMQEVWNYRLRRWLPQLVWLGDEVDVTVTLTENRLPSIAAPTPEGALSAGLVALQSGAFYKIETALRELGIEFDTGMGCEGRDWEWDWSLRGPIRVVFRGRAKHLERRQ